MGDEIDVSVQGQDSIPLEVSGTALQEDSGAFMGYLILFRDLSEIKSLKKEIERSERLASLGRLAAGVAHEIRNPLSSIKGFATYFKERYRQVPEDQKTADIMIQEVERLNRVITQLLEFARPTNIQREPTAIKDLIQHSLRIVQKQAEAKHIRLETAFAPDIGEVNIDRDRINQVLLNLYLNALEAMKTGGTLSIKVFREDHRARDEADGFGHRPGDFKRDPGPYFRPLLYHKAVGYRPGACHRPQYCGSARRRGASRE